MKRDSVLLPSLQRILRELPDGWESSPAGRRYATREDPALFVLTYLRSHLRGPETGGAITYSTAHADWYRDMAEWAEPAGAPRSWRRIYIAPRASAKSTHWFLFAPLWALAHGHSSFVASFADASAQAEGHLATFRRELLHNTLLRTDYPELCVPAGTFDNRTMYQARSGAVFAARGIDAASLGMKIGERRPDVLVMDDIEPGGGVYSSYQAGQRRKTLVETILPLNEYAKVVWVGTVTMPGSLIHQAMQGAQWVSDEGFTVHHHLPIVDGESMWPGKWPLDYLLSIQHQRSYALNFLNRPLPEDGDYWQPDDIAHTAPNDDAPQWVLSIDPAVTDKRTSDDSALAVLSHDKGKVQVRDVRAVKATGRELRRTVEGVLARWPQIRVVLVETNQGGNLWAQVFEGLPVRYRSVFSSAPKPVRAGWLLEHYQRGAVTHAEGWDDSVAVEQLLSFPRAADDVVDAIGTGARYFLGDPVDNRGTLMVRSR